jgi:hypothetical protein
LRGRRFVRGIGGGVFLGRGFDGWNHRLRIRSVGNSLGGEGTDVGGDGVRIQRSFGRRILRIQVPIHLPVLVVPPRGSRVLRERWKALE